MDVRQSELREKTQALLQGPLKHVRAAGLAVALLPLATVAAATASTEPCPSGGTVCGVVFDDTNNNGIQDSGEPGIQGAVVTLTPTAGDPSITATDSGGLFLFDLPPGTYEIAVQIPPGTQPSPPNVGGDDDVDSDGVSDGHGSSTTTVTFDGSVPSVSTDFGFHTSSATNPGTGTPGYWKNHPEAWPVNGITVGGVLYSNVQAISWLERVGKDKTTTMFSSLVSAKLNVLIGNDSSCVSSTIDAADKWMATYGPVGSGVHAASVAWKVGEPLHRQMDNYNNGMLCAPHRD